MFQGLIKILIVFFIYLNSVTAQQFSIGSPEWLVDMFFVKSSFLDKANYFSGEMLKYAGDPTIGEELDAKGEISFHQIKTTENEIVFAVEVTHNNEIIDFYCYLIKLESKWNINAVRRFLLPSFIYTVRDSLLQLNSLTTSDSTFLQSLQLFTESDFELKNYLKINLKKFQELISSYLDNNKTEADKILSSVGCNAIYSDRKYSGCIFIQVLKFEKMEAGFINTADSFLLPEISFKEFICIEEVVSGWFIYRIM
jgi:hypothetical protein